jgi:hypothetical protein
MRLRVTALFLLVALAAGCGSDDADQAAAPQPVTVTQTQTETVIETETLPAEPEVTCSTAGLRLTLPEQEELPQEVAEVRERVFDAAVACDYDALEQIALEQGEGFTFSYGAGTNASEHWREVETTAEESPLPMHALATILTMPFTRNESGSYAWPTAYSETPTEEAWQALVDSGLYSQDEIDGMRTHGTGYLGYRTAITADGDWQFFVAGD